MGRASMAAAAAAVLVLLVLANGASALIVQQRVTNECSAPLTLHCKSLDEDFLVQTLAAAAFFDVSLTTTLDDPDLTCTFFATGVPGLTVEKAYKIWEYLKSGFTDSPEMSCSSGCFWKTKDDGLYYVAGGSDVLKVLWPDIIPGVIV